MAGKRFSILVPAGSVAGSLLVAAAWAQPPGVPARPVYNRPGAVSTPCTVCEPGPVKKAANHTWHALQDNFVGYPQEFVEPPVGFYNHEIFAVQRAKADPHRFTLYRSDFLAGTSRLSTAGATRFGLIAARLRTSPLPVVVEWAPHQPGLAEARRAAVLALLQGGGLPAAPEQVVIGPVIYPGGLGTDAANNHGIMIGRDQQAPAGYSLTPNVSGGSFSGPGGAP